MKYVANYLVCIVAAYTLSACGSLNHWLHKADMEQEESFAAVEVKTPHPVAAKYDVMTSSGERKEITLYFDSKGLVRIIFTKNPNCKKILDYKKKQYTTIDFTTKKEETEKFDPYMFPAILSAKDAQDCGAVCIGTGRLKENPYHRWRLREKENEWEVWTDDNDSFPVYFRAIKSGTVATWSLIEGWIDESLCKIPTFFKLEPDEQQVSALRKRKERSSEVELVEEGKHPHSVRRHKE